jgi:hypothetical protein
MAPMQSQSSLPSPSKSMAPTWASAVSQPKLPKTLNSNDQVSLTNLERPMNWYWLSQGYLAWAACGKDPGYSPVSLLEQAARSTRYSAAEVAALVAFSRAGPRARPPR